MMALKNLLMTLTLISSLFAGGVVMGQVNIPSPRFAPKAIQESDATRPFAEPGIFDYDGQMWAPVEFTNGKQRSPNTGFFFGYERVYSNLKRGGQVGPTPNTNVPVGSDWNWGNRFELGLMSDDDSGWDVIYQKVEGSYFSQGSNGGGLVTNPAITTTNFSQLEVNKIYRQTLSNGSYFEPYIGFRYLYLSDRFSEDTNRTIGGLNSGNRFQLSATNSAPAFQLGGRYNTRKGRYRITYDAALAAAYNHQTISASDITTVGVAVGVTENHFKGQSFMPALDGQVEIAYDLSRDIAFKTSFQLMYLWNGVNRSNNLSTEANPFSLFGTGTDRGIFDSDFVAAGFTFGVEWRR